MKHLLPLLLGLLTAFATRAATFEERFAVVMIDAETEARLGEFPIDRAHVAKALDRATALKARGVVLKFFYDQARDEASDSALAKAMTQLPVVLQARLDDTEAKANPLSARFLLAGKPPSNALAGVSGWVPQPALAANARDIGFADIDPARPGAFPLVVGYQGKTAKGLLLVCLELATGEKAALEAGRRVRFGTNALPMDARGFVEAGRFPDEPLATIPFHRFVAGETPGTDIEGKILIIGYDGPKMPRIETTSGPVGAHRYFALGLRRLHRALETSGTGQAAGTR